MNRAHIFLAVCLIAASAWAQPVSTDVPVTRVVLFSSGVGYFEHTGSVAGDAVTQLMFKTDQISDVLKSMIVMDLSDTGGVTSVTYASREPLLRALQSFGVDLSEEPDLTDLLHQLRGAEVTVSAPKEITGRILGVESHAQIDPDSKLRMLKNMLNLVTEGGIRSLPMDSVQNIAFSDEKLTDELDKALAVLLASRDTDRKPVDIHFSGQGERDVRIGYVAETPIWKTSYRLDLSGEKPRLQGWAILENTSDVDWAGVQLSLVSGQPISFVQDLYTPFYMARPTVVQDLSNSLRIPTYEEGYGVGSIFDDEDYYDEDMAREEIDEGERVYAPKFRPGVAQAGPAPFYAAADRDLGVGLSGQLRMDAYADKVGELFRFDIKRPVDLPRRTSTMLPLLDAEIKAEKVSIFNWQVMPTHPLNGAILTNDTGMKMLGGPVTVLDGGMYAGDASMGHLAPGDKRLISYAVDLEVLVDSTSQDTSAVTAIKIVNGTLIATSKTITTQEYVITNKADQERAVIIEYHRGYLEELVEPVDLEEITEQWFRFRKVVPAGEQGKLTVVTQRTRDSELALLGHSLDGLMVYVEKGELSESVRQALAEAIAKRQQVAQAKQSLAELTGEKQSLENSQERLRRNIETTGRDSTLGQRYLAKLDEQEDRFEQLEEQMEDARKAVETAEQELLDFINNLDIE